MNAGRDAAGSADSRSDVIVAAVLRAVVEHRLAPGTRLSEDLIGGLFGVSRTIVRSALQQLAHDGIVTLARNRGASVASPTVEDARHLFGARRVLEAELVRRAAARMGPDDEGRLDGLIEDGERALDMADRGAAIRLSGEFHLGVATIGDQPILRSFLAELIARSSLVIALYGRDLAEDCGCGDHRLLVEALAAGNAARAVRLMDHHLSHIERGLDLRQVPRSVPSLADALLPAKA